MSAADMIDSFLFDKGVTLWPGQAFNLTRDDTRQKAAVWFKDQIEQFYEHNSGIPLQIKDPDIDVAHLIAENKAAALEIERLREGLGAERRENLTLRMELAARPACP